MNAPIQAPPVVLGYPMTRRENGSWHVRIGALHIAVYPTHTTWAADAAFEAEVPMLTYRELSSPKLAAQMVSFDLERIARVVKFQRETDHD
jgi:hypothetical protein